jgi:hypothetical protein
VRHVKSKKEKRALKNDHFDVDLVNPVKLANSLVNYHRNGQFGEMAIPTLQMEFDLASGLFILTGVSAISLR